MSTNRYCIEYAKRGQASCKKCKQKIEKDVVRIGKIVPNPFGEGDMKQWFHVPCIFETLSRARATTKKIEDPGDLEGWDDIESDDRKIVMKHINDSENKSSASKKTPKSKTTPKEKKTPSSNEKVEKPKEKMSEKENKVKSSPTDESESKPSTSTSKPVAKSSEKDNLFREYRRLCVNVSEVGSYLEKTKLIKEFLEKGTNGKEFKGDLHLWVKLLLPGVSKQVYNLQSKQLIKIFSQLFDTNQDEMIEDLEQGDIAETIRIFFEQSEKCKPTKKSTITLQEVDGFLKELAKENKEKNQMHILEKITKRSTGNDLKMVVRLIKHDLRINAGPKHVLEALHDKAYEAFQASRDLNDVIDRILESRDPNSDSKEIFGARAALMTPVLPMLAEACKSVEYAFTKCPNKMFAEIKYDGERVQVHKKGDEFRYFSRSLKPVLPHKVEHLKEFIPKAFEFGKDLILDSEVLLIDTKDGKPLPFGSLGKHKKEAFKEASVCLFVFDCLHYNGENLMEKPLFERKEILSKVMKEIPNHVVFSEIKDIETQVELKDLIEDVISQGLEGLVLKDKKSKYSPGKRHWLKVKKDYLEQGAMADSADLVVLGAYFGTGQKGGMMSIFLMGCWDEDREKWCTVTKVHGGHDDKTLEKLQDELDMVKISKDFSKVPSWLDIKKPLVPDFICRDPKITQIWEITGAEFSKAEAHTAGGISIRFPRVTKIRTDKTWKEATKLQELKLLFKNSKQTTEFKGIKGSAEKKRTRSDSDTDVESTSSTKKIKQESPPSTSKKSKDDYEPKANIKRTKLDFSEKESPDKKKGKENSCLHMFHDVFTDVKLNIPESVKDYKILRRYFIAFDGQELQEHEMSKATHILYVGKDKDVSKGPKGAFAVTPDWLWDSIKLKKKQNEKLYGV